MRNAIKTWRPQISIKLWRVSQYKGGKSTRYAGVQNPLDLTPFLGDFGYVTTSKGLNADAGAFVISFSNKADPRTGDSVYALISPMDYVEIRMAHDSAQRANGELPIVMRGFVNRVGLAQRMDDDGKPLRSVVVHGQDYGKILGQILIFYGYQYELGQGFSGEVLFSANTGVRYLPFSPPGGFFAAVMDNVVTPFLDKMWHASALASARDNPWKIHQDLSSVTEGAFLTGAIQQYQGSLWKMFREFCDPYWNELFVQDRDDGAYLVYRPFPFRDIHGNWINGGRDPGTVNITLADVVAQELDRTDAQVGNYFWVVPVQFLLTGVATSYAEASFNQEQYILRGDDAPNCDPDLYGWRPMRVYSYQGFTGQASEPKDLKAADQDASDGSLADWIDLRRRELVRINQDNVLFESGRMTLFGNPAIRAGLYLDLDYGAYHGQYYVTAVTQQFAPMEGYTTQVEVVRGTGWINRLAAEKSPYYAERAVGAFGGG